MSQPLIIPKTSRRELLIAVAIGALIIAAIIIGILSMNRDAGGPWTTGRITAKHFQPMTEAQVDIGKSGVHGRTLDGTYTLEITGRDGKPYTVWVDKTAYEGAKIGGDFRFMRPQAQP